MGNIPDPLVNDTRAQDGRKFLEDIGKKWGQGADGFAKAFMHCANGAVEGYYNTDKDSDGMTDARRNYLAVQKGFEKGNTYAPAKNTSVNAQVSKFNTSIRLGMKNVHAVELLERVTKAREARAQAGDKVPDLYRCFQAAAKEQLAQDDDLSDEQVGEIVTPKSSDEPTIEDWAEKTLKTAEQIITGEHKHFDRCQDDWVQAVHDALSGYVTKMVTARDLEATEAEIAALEAKKAELAARG